MISLLVKADVMFKSFTTVCILALFVYVEGVPVCVRDVQEDGTIESRTADKVRLQTLHLC